MAQNSYKSIITGLLFVGMGIILLLHNMNLLPPDIPDYVFTWKMLLIVLGVYFLLLRAFFLSFILLGLGGYFLFPQALGIAIDDFHLFWPAILIFLGISMLFGHSAYSKKKQTVNKMNMVNENTMGTTVIFSGESKQYSSYDFKGGKITTIFGGLEIDLVNCCLTKENNVIEVLAICGGISLTVPKEWNVKSEIVPILAGVHDTITETPNAYIDPAAELTLKGLVVMGGIEIKRA